MLDTKARHHIQTGVESCATGMIKLGMSADTVTILGAILGLTVPIFIIFDNTVGALLVLWLSGLFDAIDGTVARIKGGSPIGTLLDITLDRIVELAIIITLAFKYPFAQPYLLILVASIVICMSVFLTAGILVSKFDIKSFYYSPGLMERTETFIMLSLFIIGPKFIIGMSWVFTILILFTSYTRFRDTSRILYEEHNKKSPEYDENGIEFNAYKSPKNLEIVLKKTEDFTDDFSTKINDVIHLIFKNFNH